MSDDFDPEVLRELEENFRMINATAGALSGTLDKLNVASGGQSQAQKAETEARQKNIGGITASTRVQEAAAKATAEMAERQKNFAEATGKSTDALVGFTTAMIDGKGKFTDFNKGLGDAGDAAFALGKNFGPVGAIIGGLVKGATMAAQEMTRLSDAQVTLTKDLRAMGGISGASSDELFRLGNEAGITAENFGNITKIAQDASSALTSLGGTSGEGQRQMLEMFKVDKKTRMAFARTGIDLEQLQEGMADYLKLQEASGFQLGRSNKTALQIQKSSMDYVSNLQVLSDLTGKRIGEIKEEQQRVASQLREQMEVRRVEIEISNMRKAAAAAGDPVEKARLEALADGMQQEQDMRQQFMADATGSLGAETAIQLSKVMRTGAFDQDSVGLSQLGINPEDLKERFSGMDEGSDEYKDEFAKFLGEFKEGQDNQIERLGTAAQFGPEDQMKRLLGGTDEQSFKLASKIGTTGEGEGSEVDRQRKIRYAQAGRKGGGEDGEKLIGAQVALQETQRDLATSAERVIQSLNPLTGEMNAAKVAMVALTASAGLASLSLGAMSLGGPLGKATKGLTGMFKGLGRKLSGTKLNSAGRLIDSKTSKFVKTPKAGALTQKALGKVKAINPLKGLDVKGLGQSLGKTIGPQMAKASAAAAKASASVLQASAKASSTILQKTLTTSIGPLSKVLGPAGVLAVGFGEFTEFNRDKAKIDQQVADGLITNAEADEAKQNEMGEGIGSTAGAAIGTAIGALGGPLGMIVGGYIGKELGGWLGKKATEDDKPEANREDLNAARKLDVYNENAYGDSEIDFDKLEETMLAGQLKPEMLEAMLLDDDLGEEDQAKLVGIMDEIRASTKHKFEIDKTAEEREKTLADEKAARDEEAYKKDIARKEAMANMVKGELDESKKTAGTKADLNAAELAQKELGLKGEAEINALLSEASRGVIGGLDSTAEGIVGGGDKVKDSITESGDKLAESGPSLMSTLFKGLLGAIPGANLLKKGMDFFKGKDEVEEETQLAEEKSTKRDMSIKGRNERRLAKLGVGGKESQSVSGSLKMGKPDGTITLNGKEIEPGDPDYEKASQALMAKAGGNKPGSMSNPHPYQAGAVDPEDLGMEQDFDTAAQFGNEDQMKQLLGGADSIEEFESGPGMFASLMGKVKDMTGSLLGDGKSPEEKIYDKSMADGSTTLLNDYSSEGYSYEDEELETMSFDAEPVAEEKESGPGLFAKMSEKVKSMVGGLFGGSAGEEDMDLDALIAEAKNAKPEDDGSSSAMAFIENMKAEREQTAQNLGLLDLAGEASGQIQTPPDARTILAKEATEEVVKGKSTPEAEVLKETQNTEMLETLKLIAQNGSEQNAKLSAIADASEAGVNVNKKIYASTNV